MKFREQMFQRQQRQALLAFDEAQHRTGLNPEAILNRIRQDDGLAGLFAATIETAMRTHWKEKLRALGRVLARGLMLIRNGLVTDPFYVNGVLRITDLGRLVLSLVGEDDPTS